MSVRPAASPPLLLLLGLAALLGAVRPAAAQRVDARVSADSVTVGDRFTLTLTARHNFQLTPFFPPADADSLFGDLEVLGRSEVLGRYLGPDAPGMRLDSVVYEVTTFALDTALVPPIPIPFSTDADTMLARTPPLRVEVGSLVPEDAEGLQDLAPLAAFPRPVWPWVVSGLAVLGLLAALYGYWRQRRPAPAVALAAPPLPPFEAAQRRLNALAAADLSRPDAAKPYYVELSDTLRAYLAARLGVPARERTTGELMRELARHGALVPDEARARVRRVLDVADLAKFADAHPPEPQGRAALHGARQVIDGVEARVQAVEAPPVDDEAAPAAPEPTPDADAAPRFRWTPAVVAGAVAAALLGLYSGISLLVPAVIAVAAYAVVQRTVGLRRQVMAPAFAVQLGHYGWIAVGLVVGGVASTPWLQGVELAVVLGGLAWLLARPGPGPVLLLGALQAAGLFLGLSDVLTADLGGTLHRALLVHVTLRVLALVWMAQGLRRLHEHPSDPTPVRP